MVHSQNRPQAVPYTRWAHKNNNNPMNFNQQQWIRKTPTKHSFGYSGRQHNQQYTPLLHIPLLRNGSENFYRSVLPTATYFTLWLLLPILVRRFRSCCVNFLSNIL